MPVTLPVPLSLEPMEAEPVADLPAGDGWLFEPKYDGFRCLVFRDGQSVQLQSRRQRPLARYFPEVAAAFLTLPIEHFVLDGELIIPEQPFDTLQLRLHPAASRIRKLSQEHPAQFIAFDLLADEAGSRLDQVFDERQAALEAFARRAGGNPSFVLSKCTRSRETAQSWLAGVGHGLDGIVVKRLDLPYQAGRRAMLKYKVWQTVDCVLGGLYYKANTRRIEYLLLGLYDCDGRLNYVGRCGVPEQEHGLEEKLRPLIGGSGFTGKAPGGKSRWSNREREAVPLRPELVVEVSADHVEHGRFRHGSRLLRWRDDKAPEKCTMDQIISISRAA